MERESRGVETGSHTEAATGKGKNIKDPHRGWFTPGYREEENRSKRIITTDKLLRDHHDVQGLVIC